VVTTRSIRRLVRGLFGAITISIIPLSFAIGQTPQNDLPPGIEIVKLKWDKEARLPQGYDPSGGGSSGTISEPTRSSRGGSGGGSGSSNNSASTTQGLQPPAPSRVFFVYVYSLKIRNNGSKTIEGVAWDYVFLDPSNSTEVGRHKFLSFERVASEKTVNFQAQQRTPPLRTIKGQDANDKHVKLLEEPLIQCVLYTDGTEWRNPKASEDVCNLLRKGKSGLSRKPAPSKT
jgi:hypothetical protein